MFSSVLSIFRCGCLSSAATDVNNAVELNESIQINQTRIRNNYKADMLIFASRVQFEFIDLENQQISGMPFYKSMLQYTLVDLEPIDMSPSQFYAYLNRLICDDTIRDPSDFKIWINFVTLIIDLIDDLRRIAEGFPDGLCDSFDQDVMTIDVALVLMVLYLFTICI